MIDPEISKYFSKLAKKRTDNKRGFSDPAIVKKAIAIRKKNRDDKETKNQSES